MSVAVSAPGSSANLGPGFDVLGLAVDLRATVGTGDPPTGAHAIDDHHPAWIAHRRAGGDGSLWVQTRLPMGRGLGFSGAVRAAGAMLAEVQRGGAAAIDDDAARHRAYAVAAELEGHGDNAAASVFGGLTVAAESGVLALHPHPGFALVVWIPDATTSTDRSRVALSDTVAREDAVAGIANTALLIHALTTGATTHLPAAVADRLHQPGRLMARPDAAAAMEALGAAGALATWLSGSGPTVAGLVDAASADAVARQVAVGEGEHVRVVGLDINGVALV